MPDKVNNPRRDFIKKVSIAAVAVGAFSFLNFRKKRTNPDFQVGSMSMEEANEIIKNDDFYNASKVKPSPPPVSSENIWMG